jgi:hypothetical protein
LAANKARSKILSKESSKENTEIKRRSKLIEDEKIISVFDTLLLSKSLMAIGLLEVIISNAAKTELLEMVGILLLSVGASICIAIKFNSHSLL